MFKRILALVLCLVLAGGMVPSAQAFGREPIEEHVDRCCHTLRVNVLDPNYVRPNFDGKLIEITPQRVEDTFDYLNEHYVENYPEAALEFDIADAEDRSCIANLAKVITSGCTTNRQKADAIDAWLDRNIVYDLYGSAYANDAFYNRIGNCLSYANLMQYMLRSLGIPAVLGDGWRGDMTKDTVDLFNYDGHAWCFVYLEGQWVLYDPLWLDGGTTDRDYMAKHIYFDTVEYITPASDGDNLPPEAYDKGKAYYTDGSYYTYSDFYNNTIGNLTMMVNNSSFNFTCNQEANGAYDGWYILTGEQNKADMKQGEIYRGGWISYGDYRTGGNLPLTYAHHNGMQLDGAVMEYDGVKRFMDCNYSFPILANEKDYSIQYGTFTLPVGYVGKYLGLPWGSEIMKGCKVTLVSGDESVATIDQNGTIRCKKPGFVTLEYWLERVNEDGSRDLLSILYSDVFVSDENRVPNYSGKPSHKCSYVYSHTNAATCENRGHEVHACSVCGKISVKYTTAPLGHAHRLTVTIPATCRAEGLGTWTCSRCGDAFTKTLPVDPEGHDWEGTVCTLCGDTRLTPFDDVAEGEFYESPVAWAVEKGITAGTGDGTFSPNNACQRAQVVTFLWRAAGCPEPQSNHNPFTDVKATDFFYKSVLWAVENGITNGTSATTFGPFDVCNRAAVVTFLYRAAGSSKPGAGSEPFVDVGSGDFFYNAVLWAVENGITNGMDATHFGPVSSCNRAQVVTFLWRAFGK